MSASPADAEVQAIYELLSRIEATQRRHDNRFAEIGDDIADLRGQVAALDTKLTSLDTKVTSLDTKVDRILGLLET